LTTICPPPTFSLNPLLDIQRIWCYNFMQNAIITGVMIAVMAGATGYFVVLRRSAFTAHAFSEIGFAGASGAILLSIAPIYGLLFGSILGGVAISALGRRVTNRDTQIGIVLAFSLGLGLLFISLYNLKTGEFSNAAVSILFGEIIGVSNSEVTLTIFAGIGILLAVGFLYRPLLFASLDEDVAEAKGMPMVFLGTAFMLVVAIAVSFAVQVTGVLLIFSLMVTPAATAQYLARKPMWAIIISVTIALIATLVGLFVAFFTPYPVSFFITAIAFAFYLLVRAARALIKPRKIGSAPKVAEPPAPGLQV
jgi:zinc/manganese transport system permease protein